jgi:hypothetical protein
VERQERTDLECLGAVVRTENVMDHEHVAIVQSADANGFTRMRR